MNNYTNSELRKCTNLDQFNAILDNLEQKKEQAGGNTFVLQGNESAGDISVTELYKKFQELLTKDSDRLHRPELRREVLDPERMLHNIVNYKMVYNKLAKLKNSQGIKILKIFRSKLLSMRVTKLTDSYLNEIVSIMTPRGSKSEERPKAIKALLLSSIATEFAKESKEKRKIIEGIGKAVIDKLNHSEINDLGFTKEMESSRSSTSSTSSTTSSTTESPSTSRSSSPTPVEPESP